MSFVDILMWAVVVVLSPFLVLASFVLLIACVSIVSLIAVLIAGVCVAVTWILPTYIMEKIRTFTQKRKKKELLNG